MGVATIELSGAGQELAVSVAAVEELTDGWGAFAEQGQSAAGGAGLLGHHGSTVAHP